MKRSISIFLLATAFILGIYSSALAFPFYKDAFNTTYGTTGTVLNTCGLCHMNADGRPNPAGGTARNLFGVAYANNGHIFNAALEALDSDGDGVNSITEINARTFPGWAASHPAAADTTAPTVTAFTIPAASSALTVSISSFTATDNVGVTGYMVTESSTAPAAGATGWSAIAPASYTFASAGAKTLFAWAKDAAGKVSASLSASVTITSPDGSSGPDLSIWVGKWVKLVKRTMGYHVVNSKVKPDSSVSIAYLKILSWDQANKVLEGVLFGPDSGAKIDSESQNDNIQWLKEPFTLNYLAGSALDFLGSSQVTDGGLTAGFAARIRGWKEGDVLEMALFQTLGGYYQEVTTDTSGAADHAAGGLSITGRLVPESKVPVPADIIAVQ